MSVLGSTRIRVTVMMSLALAITFSSSGIVVSGPSSDTHASQKDMELQEGYPPVNELSIYYEAYRAASPEKPPLVVMQGGGIPSERRSAGCFDSFMDLIVEPVAKIDETGGSCSLKRCKAFLESRSRSPLVRSYVSARASRSASSLARGRGVCPGNASWPLATPLALPSRQSSVTHLIHLRSNGHALCFIQLAHGGDLQFAGDGYVLDSGSPYRLRFGLPYS